MVNQSQFIEMFVNRGLPIQHLPDISENLDNKRIPITSGSRVHGPYPYYGASGIVDYVEDFIFDEELLLISEDGANLKDRVTPIAFVAQGKYWVNNHAHILRFKCKEMQTYVEHLINYLNVEVYLTGMAQPKLNQEQLNSIPIPIPDEDRLDSFNLIVRQADKSKFAGFKSQFISQFGDCRIPKVELSSLCTEFLDGDWIESKDQSDSGYRLVQTGNVGNGEYIDKAGRARFVSDDTFKRLNCTEIHPGDILFSRLQEPLGRCCILPEGFPKAITAVDCTIARLGEKCFPEFLVVYTSTELYSAQVNKCVTGTTRQRISRNNLAKILVPCPDIKEQQLFVQFAQHADKSKYLN